MFVSDEHPLNALSPMLDKLSERLTLVRLLHPENALSPIAFTLPGISTSVKEEQPEIARKEGGS